MQLLSLLLFSGCKGMVFYPAFDSIGRGKTGNIFMGIRYFTYFANSELQRQPGYRRYDPIWTMLHKY
jgi:hypothetical protein